jgi:hypothetical protein
LNGGCCGFATLLGHLRDLFLHFIVVDFNVFGGGNAVEKQLALTSSMARSRWRRIATQSTFTARGSTPCAASVRTTRSTVFLCGIHKNEKVLALCKNNFEQTGAHWDRQKKKWAARMERKRKLRTPNAKRSATRANEKALATLQKILPLVEKKRQMGWQKGPF